MHSRCDLCGANLRAGDAQPEALYVKCSTCGGLYALMRSEAKEMLANKGISQQVIETLIEEPGESTARSGTAASGPTPRLKAGWKVEREGDVLHIRWPWFSNMFWGAAVACLLAGYVGWAGSQGLWRMKGGSPMGPESIWTFSTASLVFGYVALLKLFNHTRIEASPRRGLEVRHGPIPCFIRSPTVDIRDIRQLYGQGPENQRIKEGSVYTYELRVLSRDGGSRTLVGEELSPEQVLFLERTLEEHLGIVDEPVPGELKTDDPKQVSKDS
ncbi:MAG TPA: hypothetical protein VEY88_14705 [Archangium sp.]|nr:hypothetical protein [Archangium sp.]